MVFGNLMGRGWVGRVMGREHFIILRDFNILILYNFYLGLIVGWGLGGIPGSEAERTTCPNKRGRDKTEFCH